MMKSPDWEYWGRMRDVTLRDALVLSLNLCPNAYNHETKSRKAKKFAKKYLANLQIVKSHIYGADWLVGRIAKTEFDVDLALTTVDFPKFCIWAFDVVKLVDLPEQMKLLADPNYEAKRNAPEVVEAKALPDARQNKGGRTDILSPVIERARKAAVNPDKWQEVWPILCDMAAKKVPPLIGLADTTVKYQDGDTVKFLSKDNLSKRMRRQITRDKKHTAD